MFVYDTSREESRKSYIVTYIIKLSKHQNVLSLAPDPILCMRHGPGAPSRGGGGQIDAMLQFSSVIVFVILAAAAKFVY